jgi:hypothetical protein
VWTHRRALHLLAIRAGFASLCCAPAAPRGGGRRAEVAAVLVVAADGRRTRSQCAPYGAAPPSVVVSAWPPLLPGRLHVL